MCYLLTVGVKQRAERLRELVVAAGLQIGAATATDSRTALGDEFDAYDVHDGHCACDLLHDPSADHDRLARKYRRKGWTDAKIARALASHDRARDQKPNPRAAFVKTVARYVEECGELALFGREPTVRGTLSRRRTSLAEYVESGGDFPMDEVLVVAREG